MNERGVMFSRILVAIDGSQISMNAANYALSIAAKHHDSELTLLHVIPPEVKLGHASGMLGVVTPKFKEKVEQEAEKWFDKIKAKLNNSETINLYSKVISTGASVGSAIVGYAENKNIDDNYWNKRKNWI